MDMSWADDAEDSFRVFQGKILNEYDRMVDEFGLTVIDASRSIEQQQYETRQLISKYLKKRRSKYH